MRESRDPAHTRGSEIEKEHGHVRHPELGIKEGALGVQKVTAGW